MTGRGSSLWKLFQHAALRERALARRGHAPTLNVMELGWRKWVCVDGWFAELNEPPRARRIESLHEPGVG